MKSPLPVWGRIVVPFVGSQGVIYLINAVSGWLLVRLLPPGELALFTSGFAAFTMLNVIANGSVASVMTSQGALVVGDPREMRGLIGVVQIWRLRLAALAAIVALPLLAYSLHRLGYPPIVIAAGLALGCTYVALNIAEQAWTVVLRLHDQYKRLQRLDLQNAVVRFVAIATTLTLWQSGLLALSITVGAEALLLLQVRRAAAGHVARQPGAIDFRPVVARVVREAVPGVAFFAAQGQISIWMMMLLGSHLAIAGIGALGRVSAVYALLGPLIDNVVAPRYARLSGHRLATVYRQLVLTALLAAALLTLLLLAGGDLILALLGPAYRDLRFELSLVLVTAGIGFVATMVGTLNKARSWVRRSWLLGPVTILTQFFAMSVLPIATLRGALLLGLVSVLPGLFLGLYQAFNGLRTTATGMSVARPCATQE